MVESNPTVLRGLNESLAEEARCADSEDQPGVLQSAGTLSQIEGSSQSVFPILLTRFAIRS